jgi:hypothetical protein
VCLTGLFKLEFQCQALDVNVPCLLPVLLSSGWLSSISMQAGIASSCKLEHHGCSDALTAESRQLLSLLQVTVAPRHGGSESRVARARAATAF